MAVAAARSAEPAKSILTRLHEIKIGGNKTQKIKRQDLIFIFRNIVTLLENGLSLQKTLATLAMERTLKRYSGILSDLRRRIEAGESFSSALGEYPDTFSPELVNQVRVGERAGTLSATLLRINNQMEKSGAVRSQVLKKLSYPLILVVAGTACVTFMLTVVVPTFKETYAQAGVALPGITVLLMNVSSFLANYGWLAIVFGVIGFVVLRRLRRNKQIAFQIDRLVLQLPLVGPFLRDLITLQLMDSLGNMLEAGFTVVDALRLSGGSVRNQFVRQVVEQLHQAVMRGERFSRELDKYDDLFPPIVHQLVVTGEKTGKLPQATAHIREHLGREIERSTGIFIGTIEPVLTIGMAGVIGVILLAIYLPIFDMVQTTGSH